jgi:hypothetical protein
MFFPPKTDPLPKLLIYLGIGNQKENAIFIEGLFLYEAPPPFFFSSKLYVL